MNFVKRFEYVMGGMCEKEALAKRRAISSMGRVKEDKKGFVGHKVKDIRIIGKRGIYYRDKVYTFEGYEKYVGKTVTFSVGEECLVVNLENEIFHAK